MYVSGINRLCRNSTQYTFLSLLLDPRWPEGNRIASSETPTGSGAPPHGFTCHLHLRHCVGESESLVFKVKKLLEDGNDLKTIRRGGPKPKKRTVAAKRHFVAPVARNPLKANSSPLTPTLPCLANICCSGSLLHQLDNASAHSRKWALWSEPCRCGPQKWDDGALKLPRAQAVQGEGHCFGGSYSD